MAVIIKTNGILEALDDMSLPSLQSVVGGYIELLYTKKRDRVFICNEEGKIKGLKPNNFATRMAYITGAMVEGTDYFAGDVIMCTPKEIE